MTSRTFVNPAARTWRTSPIEQRPIQVHRALPGYAATPLTALPAFADELGVGRVFVKDESDRLGLPSFKILGASFAVARELSRRLGEPRTLTLEELRERVRGSGWQLAAATEGNHGRAVAHAARLVGLPAVIYVPPGVSAASRAGIETEGAQLIELDRPYDDVVEHVGALASDEVIVIQDTAWDGYEEIPQWVVDGYSTMLDEVDEALAAHGITELGLVTMPAGVGSFAQAVVAHYRSTSLRPALLLVEPDTAPSVTVSLERGEASRVDTAETVMTGLNCGTVSSLAWPILSAGVDVSVTISDALALQAVEDLAALSVDAGPCGAATLGGTRVALADPILRDTLGITSDSVVVLLSTEGRAANPKHATDEGAQP